MARIILPDHLPGQIALTTKIKDKNTADGSASVIAKFLEQHDIDLDDDETNLIAAKTHDDSAILLDGQAKDYRELRDLKMNPIIEHVRKELQFLKNFYKPNTSELEKWGATITTGGRITIPGNATDAQQLVKSIKTQHETFPTGDSPLQPLLDQQNIDLAQDLTNIDNAASNDALAITADGNAENERETRDNLSKDALDHQGMIGEQLLKTFPTNPQKLIDWGYQVDQSPRKPKVRTSTLKLSTQITTKGIVIGSAITNLGAGDLHVYKGASTTGTPTILAQNEKLGIAKGMSTMTLVNPSATDSVKFTVLIVN